VGGVVIKVVESFFGNGKKDTHKIYFDMDNCWIKCTDCFIKDNVSESDLRHIVELFSKGEQVGIIEGHFALSCEGLIFQHA
jgi:hypothetical protein